MPKYWQRVLRPGSFGKPDGSTVSRYEASDLRAIADNGNRLLERGILAPIPLNHHDESGNLPMPVRLESNQSTDGTAQYVEPLTGREPQWNPLINQGFVQEWRYVDPETASGEFASDPGWLMALMDIPEGNTETIEALDQQRVKHTSLGSYDGYHVADEPDLQLEGKTPLHLALVTRPNVPGQDGPRRVEEGITRGVALLSELPGPLSSAAVEQKTDPAEKVSSKGSHFVLLSEMPEDTNGKGSGSDEEMPSDDDAPKGGITLNMSRLIEVARAAGIHLEEDTTPQNVVERLTAALGQMAMSNGGSDNPLGPAPSDSEAKEPPVNLMSQTNGDTNTDPVASGLLAAAQKRRRTGLTARANKLVESGRIPQDYFDQQLAPLIEGDTAAVLLDERNEPQFDDSGDIRFSPSPIDQVLGALEAVQAPNGADLLSEAAGAPTPGSESEALPSDLDQSYSDEERADALNRARAYYGKQPVQG